MNETARTWPRRCFLAHASAAAGALGWRLARGAGAAKGRGRRPNIIFILTDDLGYGDVGRFNPRSRIKTPHIDRLAAEGIRFTDAHAPASICVPSRYGLLTGRFPFRTWSSKGRTTRLRHGKESPHYKAPMLIHEPARLNLASLMKRNGCATACFGKWHQGMSRKPAADGMLPTTPAWAYTVQDRTITPDRVVETTGKGANEKFQLYDLSRGPAEETTLATKKPEKVGELFAALKANIERGRTRR